MGCSRVHLLNSHQTGLLFLSLSLQVLLTQSNGYGWVTDSVLSLSACCSYDTNTFTCCPQVRSQ
jgi:hypothetical protein